MENIDISKRGETSQLFGLIFICDDDPDFPPDLIDRGTPLRPLATTLRIANLKFTLTIAYPEDTA